MQITQTTPSSLSLLIQALDQLEQMANISSVPARYALTAALDVVDQAFELANLLASGEDPRSEAVRVPFKFAVAKLAQTNELLGLPDDSPEAMCLDLLNGGPEEE